VPRRTHCAEVPERLTVCESARILNLYENPVRADSKGRTLRWACEQAASPNPKLAAVGVETIRELQLSQRLAPEDMRLVITAAGVLLRPALEAYRLDHDVEVVLVVDEPPDDEGRA